MKEKIRIDLLIMCLIIFLIDISLFIFNALTNAGAVWYYQVIRSVVIIGLFSFVILKQVWAQWAASVLLLAFGSLNFIASLVIVFQGKLRGVLLLLLGAFYVASAVYIFSTFKKNE